MDRRLVATMEKDEREGRCERERRNVDLSATGRGSRQHGEVYLGRSVKLVVVTQRADPDDEALGATVAKLRALAERFDELSVIELGADARLGRGARLARALARELVPRPVAVLAHMSPIYATIAAPLARPLGV